MKLNQKRAKESSLSIAAGVGGAIGAFALAKTVAEQMPDNKMAKFAPHAILAAALVLPSLDVTPNSSLINSALLGAAVVSGISVTNQFTAPAEGEEVTGLKATIAKYVPQLSGISGLGSLVEYSEAYSPSALLGTGEAAYQPNANMLLGNLPMGKQLRYAVNVALSLSENPKKHSF